MTEIADGEASKRIDSFRRSLAETVAWCGLRLKTTDPSRSLRSRSLQPDSYDPARDWLCYTWGTLANRSQIIDALSAKRTSLLIKSRGQQDRRTVNPFSFTSGRLVLYYPDANLYDGAAEVLSHGYFDHDNAPPWDTWVYYVYDPPQRQESQSKVGDAEEIYQQEAYASYLISWVPEEFILLAGEGLWANPEQCLVWADEVDTPFIRMLRVAGVLVSTS